MELEGISRYLYKGVDKEDVYQEAYLMYLENKDKAPEKIKSRIRTHLMRVLDKEYKYHSRHCFTLEEIPETVEELRPTFGAMVRDVKIQLHALALVDYCIVCLYWGLTPPLYSRYSLQAVSQKTGKGVKYIRLRIKDALVLLNGHILT